MPLINCRVELKLKWLKHCALAICGNDDDSHSNNIILAIEDTKFYVPGSLLLYKCLQTYIDRDISFCDDRILNGFFNMLIRIDWVKLR